MTDVVRVLIYVNALRDGQSRMPFLRTLRLTMTAQPRPDQSIDPNLLFRRMGMLQVDPSDLERDNPLLFHELQGVCASCLSKEECAQNLAQKLTTPDGMNGVRIVRIPQCCALCGGTQLSNGLNRRFFCASHDASSSSRLLDGLHA
jgi:hypothetical protein